MSKKTFIVIPAYNEAKVIASVIKGVQKQGFKNILVVDDGSKDQTYEEVIKTGSICLRHDINRGVGAATITAIEGAKELDADIIVVFDADGQHDPRDIEKVIKPILNNECEVVLSKRRFDTKTMPFIKVLYNYTGNLVTWIFLGLWVSDSQSGLRAYSRKAAELINTQADEYEYSSMVIREIAHHKLKFKEVFINVYYTEHSKSKAKKQGIIWGIKTLYKIIWHTIS